MRIKRLVTMLLAGTLAVVTPQWASAAGTAVCSPITNTATINYDVGGVGQSMNGVAAAFNVASKVNLEVTTTDLSYVSVSPGTTQAVLTFEVKNVGNTVQDYELTGLAKLTGNHNVWAIVAADNFDAAAYSVYVESKPAADGYDALDTATYIDELAPDATKTVYVVITGAPAVLLTQSNGDIAVYALNANTHDGGGVGALGAETTNASTAGACSAPVVLADTAAGTGPDDGNLDGADSVRSAFKVTAAVLSIDKVATTLWDPINYNSGQKAIPGAIVRYVVTIANDPLATASATLTSIGDTLIASLAIDPDLKTGNLNTATPTAESAAGKGFKASVTGARTNSSGGANSLAAGTPKYYTTTSSADGVDIAGQAITATLATLLPVDAGGAGYTAGELKPGETFTLTFNVVIQ